MVEEKREKFKRMEILVPNDIEEIVSNLKNFSNIQNLKSKNLSSVK